MVAKMRLLFFVLALISTCVVWFYLNLISLHWSRQYQKIRRISFIFEKNFDFDHNESKPRDQIAGEEKSVTDLKVWLHKEETLSDSNSGWETVSRDDDVSCYPRLFAMVDEKESARFACSGANGDGADRYRPHPVQHVFFLKTHKTGTQTMASIFNRYALTHNLSVAVRKNLRGHDAESRKHWISTIRQLPAGVPHYDMITDHVRFDESSVRHFLPNDTVFVSIVREPLDAFVSAFYYYRDVWHNKVLKSVPGPDPVSTFLSDMKRWDTHYGSKTHSRMTYDFGLDWTSVNDSGHLQTSIRYLSKVFHLVMLMEAFDESLVLLKRTLYWTLPDMLYVKFNVGKTRHSYNFTEKQYAEFEKHRTEEYAIYRHFRSIFYEKVNAQDNTFAEEVKVFKAMQSQVESFCKNITAYPRKLELRVEGTRFSERFRVCLEDCQLLSKESSSVKNVWFEKLMLLRLQEWSQIWQNSSKDR